MTDIDILSRICNDAIYDINPTVSRVVKTAIRKAAASMKENGIPLWMDIPEGGQMPSKEIELVLSRITDVVSIQISYDISFAYLIPQDKEDE